MMVFRLLLVVAVVGLAGCASNEATQQPHQPRANAFWRKSLGEATFITLAVGETRQFKITPDLQTFGFPEGISYFVGIALPRSGNPHKLTLRTVPLDPLRPRKTHVFVPRVAVVAPDGSVSRYIGLNLQPIPPQFLTGTTGWQDSIELAPGESRIAVYTATLLPQTLRLPMPDEPGGYWYVPSAPTGVIEVTLDDL